MEGRGSSEDTGGGMSSSEEQHLQHPNQLLLPCKIRRNYACKTCTFASNNPRQFLYHQRDVHHQRGSIHECPFCVYASSHTHKLLRHIRLVHSALQDTDAAVLAVGAATAAAGNEQGDPYRSPPTPRPPPVVLTVPRRPPLPFLPSGVRPQQLSSSMTITRHSMLAGNAGLPLPRDLEVILVGDGGSGSGNDRQRHHHQQHTTPPLSLIRLPHKSTSVIPSRKVVEPSVVLFPVAPSRPAPSPVRTAHSPARAAASPARPPPTHQSTIFYSLLRNGDGNVAGVTRRRSSQMSGSSRQHSSSLVALPAKQAVAASPVRPSRRQSSASSTSGKLQQVDGKGEPDEYACSVCSFRSRSRVLVQRHEKVSHLKKKFFRCLRCTYVTNVRARYTKHVRYHSMPYIKCELCDFSTPYKWNLDRHRRNHLDEAAAASDAATLSASTGLSATSAATGDIFRCDRCSFACHSKQSLSVHLVHHHTESGEGSRRPRRIDPAPRLLIRLPRRPSATTSHIPENDDDGDCSVMPDDTETYPLDNEDVYDQNADEDQQMNEDQESPKEDEVDDEESGDERHLEEEAAISEYQQASPSFACAECGEAFPSRSLLDRHAFECHAPPDRHQRQPIEVDDGSENNKSRSISCDLCPYKAKWISEVVRHRRVHAQEKPYTCPRCEFRSRWKGDMTRHVQKHHGLGVSAEVRLIGRPPQSTSAESVAPPFNMEQLLDQSMMVGGENELGLYVEDEGEPSSPEQDSPLDLSKPIPPGGGKRAPTQRPVNSGSQLELLPMLLRQPPRHMLMRPNQNEGVTNNGVVLIIPSISGMVSTEARTTPAVRERLILPKTSVAPSEVVAVPKPVSSITAVQEVTTVEPTVAPSTIRKSYQCPHCSFSSTTASRFHMHMVVHLNQKPYMCSVCEYRSNWQWDITKHAKMKGSRDPSHLNAAVVLVNDSGVRNYEKYDQYAIYETVKPKTESGGLKKSRGRGLGLAHKVATPRMVKSAVARVVKPVKRRISYKCKYCEFRHHQRRTIVRHMEVHKGNKRFWCGICGQSSNGHAVILRHCRVRHGVSGPIMQRDADPDHPLPTYNPKGPDAGFDTEEEEEEEEEVQSEVVPDVLTNTEADPVADDGEPEMAVNGEALPEPVETTNTDDEGNGVLDVKKAIAGTESDDMDGSASVASPSKETATSGGEREDEQQVLKCKICPYQCRKIFDLRMHTYMHKPHEGSKFKCAFCPFFVSLKSSWLQHMRLHGEQPAEVAGHYVNGTASESDADPLPSGGMDMSEPESSFIPTTATTSVTSVTAVTVTTLPPLPAKRYTCEHCPYRTDSHTTILYHRQFHRLNPLATHRCDLCSYAVTRSHLLNQHMRVHGIVPTVPTLMVRPAPDTISPEPPLIPGGSKSMSTLVSTSSSSLVVPRVWVHRDGVFAKMFRCRHCPHVSKKRGVIVEHEKMHDRRLQPLDGRSTYECPLCNYSCRNAGILTTHMKVHSHEVGVVQPYPKQKEDGADSAPAVSPPPGTLLEAADVDHQTISEIDTPISPLDSFHNGAHGWTREEEETWSRRCFLKSGSAKPNTVYRMCGRCPAKFYKPDQLAAHRSFHASNLPFGCRSCDFASPDRKHWRRHVRVHSIEYQSHFQEVAPQSATLRSSPVDPANPTSGPVDDQLTISTPLVTTDSLVEVKRHHCDLCPASFIKHTSLVYHASLHGGDNKFKCRHCTYSVASVGNLVRHAKVHGGAGSSRSSDSSSVTLPSPDEFLRCDKCPAFFTRAKRMHFNLHVSLHGSKMQFACRRCDYATNSATTLNRHRRMHEGNDRMPPPAVPPPPPLPSSSSTSPSKSGNGRRHQSLPKHSIALTSVEQQHVMLQKLRSMKASPNDTSNGSASVITDKVFSCELCPYTHTRKNAVHSHMRRHRVAGAGPETTCPYCDYSCVMPSFLRDHVRLHTAPPTEHRHGLPEQSVAWDSMEIWARHGDERTLVYRWSGTLPDPCSDSESDLNVTAAPPLPPMPDPVHQEAIPTEEETVAMDIEQVLTMDDESELAENLSERGAAADDSIQPDTTSDETDKDDTDEGALVYSPRLPEDPVVVGLCEDLVDSVVAVHCEDISDGEAENYDQADIGHVVHSLLDSTVQLVCADPAGSDAVMAGCSADTIAPSPDRDESGPVSDRPNCNGTRSQSPSPQQHLSPQPVPAITKEELLGQLSLIPMIQAVKKAMGEVEGDTPTSSKANTCEVNHLRIDTNGVTTGKIIQLDGDKHESLRSCSASDGCAPRNGHSSDDNMECEQLDAETGGSSQGNGVIVVTTQN